MKIFVYGTLKRGHRNHNLLHTAEYLGRAASLGDSFSMYCNGSYPVLVRNGFRDQAVYGELYLVDDETLKALDWLEGVAHGLYKRESISLSVEDSYETIAEAYFYCHETEGMTKVKDGNWNGPQPKTETGHYRHCL